MKVEINKDAYPSSKNEFWRFADIKSFSENSVSSFLNGEKVEAKSLSILEALLDFGVIGSLDINNVAYLTLSKGLPNGVSQEVLSKEVLSTFDCEEFSFKGDLASKLESLVVESAKGVLLRLNNKSPKLLIKMDSSLSFSPALLKIEVEEGQSAQVFVYQETRSNAFIDSLLSVDLKKDSKLKITFINKTSEQSLLYSKANFNLGEASSLELFSMQEGTSPSRVEYFFDIAQKHAKVEATCFIKNSANCLHNLNTYQMHKVGDTSSNLTLRNVLSNGAKATFAGFVKIEKDAQCTSAQQSCKTLLLDKSATIKALPILEIEANDVECSHGCAVSMPDEEQIFYLRARGLSEIQAKELIAEGFVNFDNALL